MGKRPEGQNWRNQPKHVRTPISELLGGGLATNSPPLEFPRELLEGWNENRERYWASRVAVAQATYVLPSPPSSATTLFRQEIQQAHRSNRPAQWPIALRAQYPDQ